MTTKHVVTVDVSSLVLNQILKMMSVEVIWVIVRIVIRSVRIGQVIFVIRVVLPVVQIRQGYIQQDLLEELCDARNRSDEALAYQSELTGQIAKLLLAETPVEPGIHSAKLTFKCTKRGKKITMRVIVK